MDRYTQRVNKYLKILHNAGYPAKHVYGEDVEIDDDSIDIVGTKVSVQIDSMSGDAVAVNREIGTPGADDEGSKSWDLEDDSELLKIVKEALADTE